MAVRKDNKTLYFTHLCFVWADILSECRFGKNSRFIINGICGDRRKPVRQTILTAAAVVFFLFLCVVLSYAQSPVWDDCNENLFAGTISVPGNGLNYEISRPVYCSISGAWDTDRQYINSNYLYDNDTLTYTWTAKANGVTVGSFPNGNTGTSPVWIPPSTPTANVVITCTVNDTPKPIPTGELGERDDTAKDTSVTINIYAIDWIKIVEANGILYPNGYLGDKIYSRLNDSTPTIKIKAKVTPAVSNCGVTISYEDPDEPSGAVPNDTDIDANDNHGVNGSLNTIQFTDSNGETPIVTFNASSYGGDNYKFRATPGGVMMPQYTKTQTVTVWKNLALKNQII